MEIYKNIKDYEGLYQVSNNGKIKSLKNGILKLEEIKGYLYIQLSNKGIRKKYLVHRLVAIAFIDRIDNKKEVNHKDGNKSNNIISNLEWNSHSENTKHCVDVLWKNCKRVGKYDLEGKLLNVYDSIRQAGITNLIDNGGITKVCKGIRNTCGGHKWKYI